MWVDQSKSGNTLCKFWLNFILKERTAKWHPRTKHWENWLMRPTTRLGLCCDRGVLQEGGQMKSVYCVLSQWPHHTTQVISLSLNPLATVWSKNMTFGHKVYVFVVSDFIYGVRISEVSDMGDPDRRGFAVCYYIKSNPLTKFILYSIPDLRTFLTLYFDVFRFKF